MKLDWLVCAPVLVALMPAAALADDPKDPAMRSAAARARDREIIRQLNLRESARVQQRDAGYAEGWREWRGSERDGLAADYSARSRAYDRDRADYAQQRARYERQMAAWRRAVDACRAGDYSACDY